MRCRDHKLFPFAALIFCAALLCSCVGKDDIGSDADRKVMILYSAGASNLSSFLRTNIDELKRGDYVPKKGTGQDVLLVFCKNRLQREPVLLRIYKSGGRVHTDTLLSYDASVMASDAKIMEEVLDFIRRKFPAASYGMVFSSHSTAWLPEGYYNDPSSYDGKSKSSIALRTIGSETDGSKTYEIDLKDFAAAIPFRLDYLLIDSCFDGSIEVAYELKDKVVLMGSSQTEVLSWGFDYIKMASRLIGPHAGGPTAVCEDYLNQYLSQTGIQKSATISLIDCSKLEQVASLAGEIFSICGDAADNVDVDRIQPYFGGNKHWFYDMQDIVNAFCVQAIKEYDADEYSLSVSGQSYEGRLFSLYADFVGALSAAVPYKGTTGQYYSDADGRTHEVENFCGVSMFLPCMGSSALKEYYKTLAWNQATGLVK